MMKKDDSNSDKHNGEYKSLQDSLESRIKENLHISGELEVASNMLQKLKPLAQTFLGSDPISRQKAREVLTDLNSAAIIFSNAAENTITELKTTLAAGAFKAPHEPLVVELLTKSPLFNAIYYLHNNEDVAKSGLNPVNHYLHHGAWEKRNPHPYFDSQFYIENYLANDQEMINPLVHFILFGANKDYKPSAQVSEIEELVEYCFDLRDSDDGTDSFSIFSARNKEFGTLDEVRYLVNHYSVDRVRHRELIGLRFESSKKPKISIIIPVYGQIDNTLICISSLIDHVKFHDVELIVVDDCSPDETATILNRIEGIRVIENDNNLGFIGSCNIAASQARGDIITFLNNDTIVMPGWLEGLVETFQRDGSIALVGSKLINPDGSLQEAGGIIWRDGTGDNVGRNGDPDHPICSYMRDVDYCSGASLAIKREVWQILGGFDEMFAPGYYEDADLAFRARKEGYRAVYQPLSRVIHFEGQTAGKDTTQGMKKYQITNLGKFKDRWSEAISTNYKAGEKRIFHRDRTSIKQVLIVDALTPTPDKDSGSNDIMEFVRYFKDKHCHVSFIPQSNFLHWGTYTESLQTFGVECIYQPFYESIDDFLVTDGWRFDIVLLNRWYIAKESLPVIEKFCPEARIIFNPVDLHFMRMERESVVTGSNKILREAKKVAGEEIALIKKVHNTMLLSQREKERLDEIDAGLRVEVIPFCREIPGRSTGFEQRNDVLFLGGYAHPPNVDAVTYFVSEIWPDLNLTIPNCRLLVGGSKMPEEIRDLSEINGVETIGHVEDLSKLLNSVRLMVAPLRFGAGLKGKILSSISHGLPVIVTSLAIEGFGAIDGIDVMIADDPKTFADKAQEVYRNRDLWEKLSDNAVALARKQFSREVVHKKWDRVFDL